MATAKLNKLHLPTTLSSSQSDLRQRPGSGPSTRMSPVVNRAHVRQDAVQNRQWQLKKPLNYFPSVTLTPGDFSAGPTIS
jgi:hypothetical protein